MEVNKMTEVTPIIMPKDVRIVRPLFLRMERTLDFNKSSKDGLNILNTDVAVFNNNHAVGLSGKFNVVGNQNNRSIFGLI